MIYNERPYFVTLVNDIQVYAIPIKLKYDCPPANRFGEDPPLWKSVSSLRDRFERC